MLKYRSIYEHSKSKLLRLQKSYPKTQLNPIHGKNNSKKYMYTSMKGNNQ